MIEKKIHKLTISADKASKLEAYKKGTFTNNVLTFEANHSKNSVCVVYDTKKIIAFVKSTDTVTSSLANIKEFATEKAAETWIENSGLVYEQEDVGSVKTL